MELLLQIYELVQKHNNFLMRISVLEIGFYKNFIVRNNLTIFQVFSFHLPYFALIAIFHG